MTIKSQMTDLTEQFNNDEIDESKLYYFKQKMSEEIEIGHPFALNMVRAMDDTYLDLFLIDKVLSPVPSYDEWQAKLEENDKLKELLKECRDMFDLIKDFAYHDNCCQMIRKIDEVLK